MKCTDCKKDYNSKDLNHGQCRGCSIKEIAIWMREIEKEDKKEINK